MSEISPISKDELRRAQEEFLSGVSDSFLSGVHLRLRDALQANADVAGKGFDIHPVRTDTSKIGKMECYRLRFTPSQIDINQAIKYRDHGEITQLVIEVPKALVADLQLRLVFTEFRTKDGYEVHHAISDRRIIEVNPHNEDIDVYLGPEASLILYKTSDLKGFVRYEDLQEQPSSDEEVSERVNVITVLSKALNSFRVANQSRADGTAES